MSSRSKIGYCLFPPFDDVSGVTREPHAKKEVSPPFLTYVVMQLLDLWGMGLQFVQPHAPWGDVMSAPAAICAASYSHV